MDWDLIIFDCDGVLVDSEPIANRLIAHALSEIGLPISEERALDEFLGSKLTVIKQTAEDRLGHKLPDNWVDRIYEQQFAAFRRCLRKIPGIDSALDAIERAGVPACVGSNGPPHKMEVTLQLVGLKSRFAGRIFSADHVGIPKPAPDLYLHCARSMNSAPARCAVIEDSPRGAIAGVAAGMTVFGYSACRDAGNLQAAGCARVFADMAALPDLLCAGIPCGRASS